MLAAEYRPRAPSSACRRPPGSRWESRVPAPTSSARSTPARPGRSLSLLGASVVVAGVLLARQRPPQPEDPGASPARRIGPGASRPSRRRRPGRRPARGAGLDRAGHGVGRRHLPRQLRARLDRLASRASTRRRAVGGRGALVQLPGALPVDQRRVRGRASRRRRLGRAARVTARGDHGPGRPSRRGPVRRSSPAGRGRCSCSAARSSSRTAHGRPPTC